MKFLLIYVPNLRFREFNEQLVYTSFGHVMKLYRGSSPRPIINYVTTDKSGLNWIKIGDMPSTGNRVFFCKERINKEGSKKSRAVYKGDIILSNSMSFGKPYILEIDGFIHDGWFVIRDYQNYIDKTYLCQLLSSDVVQNQYKSTAAGGVVKNISSDLVNSVKFHLPSIMEQRKIARFLELIDQKIEVQIKIIDDLLTVKNGISNKLFKLQQIELSNHYLFEYLIEGDKTAVDTSCYKKITVKLNNQGLAFSELNREMADTRPFYVRHKGELIIGKQNYFNGSIAIVTEQFDNCICSNAIMSFKIKGIYSDFLYYQISNNNYLNSQSYKANGTGQKELSEKEFLNFKIWCPQLEVQQKIVNCFKSLDLKIENEKAILNSYFQEKSYLLNNMFI